MDEIQIFHRALTLEESQITDRGFDQIYKDEEVEMESHEKVSCVALQGNRFIGCAAGLAHKNGVEYSGWFYLSDLFVRQEFRCQGIGEKLLMALEKKLIECGIKHIWLWTSGEKSLRFYDRNGYFQFTEMERWYSDGSSRIGLRKSLQSEMK